MSDTKHTPTPWKVENQDTFDVIVGSDGGYVNDKNDRDHAVKCVNMHDELVRCLSNLIGHHDFVKINFDTEYLFVDEAREALKKAGEM